MGLSFIKGSAFIETLGELPEEQEYPSSPRKNGDSFAQGSVRPGIPDLYLSLPGKGMHISRVQGFPCQPLDRPKP